MKTLLLAPALLLAGCITNVAPPPLSPNHPASPDAAAAPLPVVSQTLQSYEPIAAAEPRSQMDHGAMGHGAMAKDSMKGMDHGAVDHGSMKGMDRDAHWTAPEAAAARKNPVKADKASIARGQALFKQNCAVCHGAAGRGDGPAGAALDPKPADLAAMAGEHPDGDFAWKIENGRGAMPPWKGVLTQNQIWDLVNFTRSLGSAKAGSEKSGGGHDNSQHKH
ncbi:MAG: c-type cytochrome [Burkholderiales bacterium]|nr:c-type cytochrome [Burkholderiales bacterium]